MIKPSPAPWKADVEPGLRATVVVVNDAEDEMVCECYEGRLEQRMANARLIAAAPDLLAALIEAENALADYVPTIEKTGASLNYGHKVLEMSRAALAKAGVQP